MIEIVFSDSACGSLKLAQSYGKGRRIGGCCGVIMSNPDGTAPTPAELAAAQREAEVQLRLEWERAVPMGGDRKDVFGFSLMLSVGDISKGDFMEKRRKAIDSLWSIYPNRPTDEPFDLVASLENGLDAIRERITCEDEVRIWYSHQPDELCGLYWFLSELETFPQQPKSVYVVALPAYEYRDENTITSHLSWGDICHSDWHKYTVYAEKATDAFRRHSKWIWNKLQQENAPLRAVLNGRIHSVTEDIYDGFIHFELAEQSEEFSEAVLIGNVLGKYQLGIGDAWLANRIEGMIANGELEIASEHPKDMPLYHRKLRKAKKQDGGTL